MVRAVLRTPGVARVFAASLLGRIPAGALGLLLILRVRELGDGYAGGGAVAGAFSLGYATAAPLVGRLVDARGQTRVLAVTAAAAGAALTALALAPAGTPLAVLLVLAAVAGGAHPPLAACLRALWPDLLPAGGARHAAYALEAAALEVSYVLGPLVIVGALATRSPALALGTCVVLLAAGTAAFAAARPSRAWRPVAGVRRSAAGALASPGVRTLVGATALVGVSFGAIEVSAVAFAEHAHARGAIGPLLAGWGLASMAGGALAVRRGAPRDRARRIVELLAALAASDALLVAAGSPLALAALLALAGLAVAPTFAVVYDVAADVAREGTVTEAFTWLQTGIGVGLALGSAAGGALAAASSARAGFLTAAAGAGLAAALVAIRRSDLAAGPDAAPAGRPATATAT
jgi:MFS family permease